LPSQFIFGALTVYQFIRELINRKARKGEYAHLLALAQSMAHMRDVCELTLSGNALKSEPAARQFTRQIQSELLTLQAQVNALMEAVKPKKD
jgi:hypothetical protein